MARKRQISDEGGVSMDSLMDALTNVVAVLILVLILVQADVTQKVEQFLDDLEPATPEQLEQTKVTLVKLEKDLEQKKELLRKDPPTPQMIEEEKRRITLLEKTTKEQQLVLADLDELKKLEMKLREERDVEARKTTKLQEEIAKLLAMLDATPVLEAPPPDVVTIPNSRPIPANAEIYYALVFKGRVHLIDPFGPLELFMKEFQRHKNDWRLERIKRQGRDRYIYDQTKIVEHFKDFDFRNPRGQTVKVLPNPMGTRLAIQVKPDAKDGGTDTVELEAEDSVFGKAMRSLSHNSRAVLMFWVNPDSFNSYLLGRTLADKAGVPAGWEVRWNTDYRIRIDDVEVRRLKEPPPPDPDAKPKPRPPRIGPKLD